MTDKNVCHTLFKRLRIRYLNFEVDISFRQMGIILTICLRIDIIV